MYVVDEAAVAVPIGIVVVVGLPDLGRNVGEQVRNCVACGDHRARGIFEEREVLERTGDFRL